MERSEGSPRFSIYVSKLPNFSFLLGQLEHQIPGSRRGSRGRHNQHHQTWRAFHPYSRAAPSYGRLRDMGTLVRMHQGYGSANLTDTIYLFSARPDLSAMLPT